MISVVIPIFNEEENLAELRQRVVSALENCGGQAFEVIFVNDGSRDHTLEMLRDYHQRDPRLKVVALSRNFGHQPAVTAGVHYAAGDCVILLDGDLQDPPEVIPELVDKWRQGFDVVLAHRRSRAEGGLRGLALRLFYPIFNHFVGVPGGVHDGIFGLMDRKVVDHFNRLPERNRFIPGLRSWLGFRQGHVDYDRQSRAAGRPKQTWRRLLHYAMDGMFSFSNKPLRVATYLGIAVSAVAFLLALYYFITFFTQEKQITGFTTTIVSVLFLGGVQLISIGVLGEYLGRIYEEVKQRPMYVVSETLGVKSRPVAAEAAVSC